MAAAPVKSQPLHNFSLPLLKWAHKNPSSSSSSSRRQQQHLSVSPTEEDEKPWNLRPRKKESFVANNNNNTNNDKINDADGVVKSKSQRLKGLVEGKQGIEKKEKRKIWISLSKEEIEEDIYAMTGGKPSRRPRKWPKNVQKQLDGLFPGLYLVGVTAETYRDQETLVVKGN